MKTALILLSILGMACAFSMKNFHRRAKLEDSEENGVFKYRPRYYLYKHAYFYPPLKRFPIQSSDSSEENGDGDSSDEEEDEEETSDEGANNEESDENEDEESEAENATLSATTPGYGEETTPETGNIGLAAIQLPKKAEDTGKKPTEKEESDEEEEEEEEEENENEANEAEVDENGQGVNGTSTNTTEAAHDGGEGAQGSDPDASAEGTTATGGQDKGGFAPATPPPEVHEPSTQPLRETTAAEYEGEYEQTGTHEYDHGYEVYENENGEPRGDTYRAYEDEYSYYKGRSYDSYDGQNYYYHQ